MGIQERRDRERMEMKKKIMDAAIMLIEQEGYEKLSIRKIAAKIQYSPTTIYLYYKDKAEIITDMSNELYCKVIEDISAVLNENAALPADKQLHQIMCAFVKGLCSEPEMVKAIMHSGIDVIFANESTDGKPGNPGITMLDRFLENGIAAGIFRPGIANTSWMIISAMLGFVLTSIGNQRYLPAHIDQLADDFAALLMEGITYGGI